MNDEQLPKNYILDLLMNTKFPRTFRRVCIHAFGSLRCIILLAMAPANANCDINKLSNGAILPDAREEIVRYVNKDCMDTAFARFDPEKGLSICKLKCFAGFIIFPSPIVYCEIFPELEMFRTIRRDADNSEWLYVSEATSKFTWKVDRKGAVVIPPSIKRDMLLCGSGIMMRDLTSSNIQMQEVPNYMLVKARIETDNDAIVYGFLVNGGIVEKIGITSGNGGSFVFNAYEKRTDKPSSPADNGEEGPNQGTDAISPPDNRRSAPRQPPEGPPPAKPGSAP